MSRRQQVGSSDTVGYVTALQKRIISLEQSHIALSQSTVTASGQAGGQTIYGGMNSGEKLTLIPNSTDDTGSIVIGSKSTSYTLPPTRGADGQVLRSDANGDATWQTFSGGVGETNTSSSVGGLPLVLEKVGFDLPFRGLTAASSKIILTTDASTISIDADFTNIDTTGPTALVIGDKLATKVEIAKPAIVTDIKGPLNTLEGVSITGNATVSGHMQLYDIAEPMNPGSGSGRLYKKTSSAGLYWKPDDAGLEVNVAAAGSGDVVGPGSSTDNALVRMDGATGNVVKNSTVTVSDTGDMAGVVNLSTTGRISIDTLLYKPNQVSATGLLSPTEASLHSMTVLTGVGPLTYNIPLGTTTMDGLCLKFINASTASKSIIVTGSLIDGVSNRIDLSNQHDTMTIVYNFNNNIWYTL